MRRHLLSSVYIMLICLVMCIITTDKVYANDSIEDYGTETDGDLGVSNSDGIELYTYDKENGIVSLETTSGRDTVEIKYNEDVIFKASRGYLKVDVVNYYNLLQSERNTCYEDLKVSTYYIDLTDVDRSKIDSTIRKLGLAEDPGAFIESMYGNIKPDMAEGYLRYKPFEKYVNVGLALLVIVTSIGLVVNIVCDIAYLVIPIFQTKNMEKRNFLISSTARKLVTDNSTESETYILFQYFKNRFLLLVILGTLISLLISNQLFILVAKLMTFIL